MPTARDFVNALLFPNAPMVRGESRDEPIPPVVEERPGVVFPYRGQELHGVDPGSPSEDPEGYADGSIDVVDDTPDEPRYEPIHVIVDQDETASVEFKDWRVVPLAVQSLPSMIVNRQRNRTRVMIKNIGTVGILLNHASAVTTLNGWVVSPNETVTLNTTEEVWSASVDGSVVPIQVLLEFNTATRRD